LSAAVLFQAGAFRERFGQVENTAETWIAPRGRTISSATS
jgi:hypothetical protein